MSRTASHQDPAARPPRLSFGVKLAQGIGATAFGIKDQGFNMLLMLYYNQVVGLPAAWVGTAIMLTMVVDGLVDPLIGHWSDGIRTRWGRRHPFMYASAIPMAIGYFLLWSPPAAGHEIQFAWLLGTSVCVRLAISCFEIPAGALVAELTEDYDERTSLSTFRVLFYAAGLVGMSVLTFKHFLQPTAEFPVGQLNPHGYATYSVVAVAIMAACVLIAALGTHHRIGTLRSAPAGGHRSGELLSGLKAILNDRALASILLCAFLFAIATGLFNSLNSYLYTYFWRFSADQLGGITGSGALAVILTPIVVGFGKRFEKKNVALTLYALALVAIVLPVTLGLLGVISTDPQSAFKWIVLKYVVMATAILGSLILVQSMTADISDHIRLETGRSMEGLLFAALILINKAVSGMGVFLSGMIVSGIGFPEKAVPGAVDPALVHRLAWFYIVSVGALCGGAIVALGFYPITRAMHQEVLARLTAAPGPR